MRFLATLLLEAHSVVLTAMPWSLQISQFTDKINLPTWYRGKMKRQAFFSMDALLQEERKRLSRPPGYA